MAPAAVVSSSGTVVSSVRLSGTVVGVSVDDDSMVADPSASTVVPAVVEEEAAAAVMAVEVSKLVAVLCSGSGMEDVVGSDVVSTMSTVADADNGVSDGMEISVVVLPSSSDMAVVGSDVMPVCAKVEPVNSTRLSLTGADDAVKAEDMSVTGNVSRVDTSVTSVGVLPSSLDTEVAVGSDIMSACAEVEPEPSTESLMADADDNVSAVDMSVTSVGVLPSSSEMGAVVGSNDVSDCSEVEDDGVSVASVGDVVGSDVMSVCPKVEPEKPARSPKVVAAADDITAVGMSLSSMGTVGPSSVAPMAMVVSSSCTL